jgi:hypothetical protein
VQSGFAFKERVEVEVISVGLSGTFPVQIGGVE